MAGTFLAAGVRVSRRHVLKAFLIGVGSLAAAAGSLVQFYGPLLAQTSSTAPALYSVHMVDTLTGWAVGTRGGLPLRGGVESVLHTTDGGIHWIDVTPPSPPGRTMFHFYDVDVLTSLSAWVSATPNTPTFDTTFLFHTVDGGQTWRNVMVSGRELGTGTASVHFINLRDGWVLATGIPHMGSEDADIYRSIDGGETWAKVATTGTDTQSGRLPSGRQGDITFLNETAGWLTGLTNAVDSLYLYVTHDGGRTWQHETLGLPPQVRSPWYSAVKSARFFTARDGILPVFYSYQANASWVVVFYVTRDGGVTWAYTTPVSSNAYWESALSFADVNHGWVAKGDALYATTDGGRQWTMIQPTPPFTNVRQIDFISPQVGWAVTPASLLKTEDGGLTWAPVVYRISR